MTFLQSCERATDLGFAPWRSHEVFLMIQYPGPSFVKSCQKKVLCFCLCCLTFEEVRTCRQKFFSESSTFTVALICNMVFILNLSNIKKKHAKLFCLKCNVGKEHFLLVYLINKKDWTVAHPGFFDFARA